MKKIALLLALMLLCLTAFALGEEPAVTFKDVKAIYDAGKYDEAFPLFEQLAAQGDADAMRYLGYLYEDGNSPSGIADYPNALKLYTQSADLGNAKAMRAIGAGYYSGIFCDGTPDYETAYDWFCKAVANGDTYSNYAIGNMYYHARLNGGVADYAAAYDYFTLAAEANNDNALYYLGMMYQDGKHVAQDDQKAFEYFTTSANMGNTFGMHELADGYKSGVFSSDVPDYDMALTFYLQAAQGGHSCAPSHVEDLLKNYTLSLDSLLKADAAGYAKASHLITDLYHKGSTLEDGTVVIAPDHARMLAYLEEKYAADTQDVYLLSWYGFLLCGNTDQDICPADYPRALEVYTKAADLGDSYSMWQIGEIYYYGNLGEADYALALDWYIKAEEAGRTGLTNRIIELCNNGVVQEDGTVLLAPDHVRLLAYLEGLYAKDTQDAYALSWLGWLLCGNSQQDVCEADYIRAFEVYKKAADLGSGYSMCQIGKMYHSGELGAVDLVAAEAWYRKAFDAGYAEAEESLNALAGAKAE